MMKRLHPLTLSFRDPEAERAFAAHSLARLRLQGRAAILVGTFVYLFYGVLDPWLVPPEYQATVWAIRLAILSVPAAVFLLTFHPAFARFNHLPLALTGLAAAYGLIAILWHLPLESISYFYPGLVLSIFYIYNFIGTRFIYALIVSIIVVLTYGTVFGLLRDFPGPVLLSHGFFILSANLIGGVAGYLAEYQRRQLFVRETELDLERKHHLERSLHDRLTGLPNRELLEDRIAQLLARARRDNGCHAGLYIDLDGFKAINDTLGHDQGDAALCTVARRLVAAVRQTDTVSRLGGDEFFVLAHDVDTRAGAVQLAEKLLKCIAEPLPGLADDNRLGASIGIFTFCGGARGGSEPEEIIRHADRAMYEAKANGRNRYACAQY